MTYIQIAIVGVPGSGKTHLIDAIQKVFSGNTPYLKEWNIRFENTSIPRLSTHISELVSTVSKKGLSKNPTVDDGTLPHQMHSFIGTINGNQKVGIIIKNIAGEFYNSYFKKEYEHFRTSFGESYGFSIVNDYIRNTEPRFRKILHLYNKKELFKNPGQETIQGILDLKLNFIQYLITAYKRNTASDITGDYKGDEDPGALSIKEVYNNDDLADLIRYFFTYLFVSSSNHLLFCYHMDADKFNEQNQFLGDIRNKLADWKLDKSFYCVISQFDRIIEEIEFEAGMRLNSFSAYARLMNGVYHLLNETSQYTTSTRMISFKVCQKSKISIAWYDDKLTQYRNIPFYNSDVFIKDGKEDWRKNIFPTSVAYSTMQKQFETGGPVLDYGLFRYPHIIETEGKSGLKQSDGISKTLSGENQHQKTRVRQKDDPITLHHHAEIYDNRQPLGVVELILRILHNSGMNFTKLGIPWGNLTDDKDMENLYHFIKGK